ncbi:MAG: hypothetical protein AB3X44_10255 [Leptothrix sp. (in: b-proteobacteria)]
MSIGREELKLNFKAGSLPTEDHFYGLIDSMLHMGDEGFRKTRDWGLEVSSAPKETALLTFFRKEDGHTPLWSIQHADEGKGLNLCAQQSKPSEPLEPVLTFNGQSKHVGVGTQQPQHRLDVKGFVGSLGRTGTYPLANEPKPDGEWHDIARVPERGCVAFEVVACAQVSQRLSMLHAQALNAGDPRLGGLWAWLDNLTWVDGWIDRTFNRKKRIRATESRFGQRCDRIELSWRPAKDQDNKPCYALAIRTRCHFGKDGQLSVQMTQLWPIQLPEPLKPATSVGQASVR